MMEPKEPVESKDPMEPEDSTGVKKAKRKAGAKGIKRRLIDMALLTAILYCALLLGTGFIKNWEQKRQDESVRVLAMGKTVNNAVEKKAAQATKAAETTTAKTTTTKTTAAPKRYVSPIDFDALKEVNPDVIAWLKIPGTNIDYPVVQAKDNETYLKKSFEGKKSAAGAVFLDCASGKSLLGYHSIMYGHHMKNKTMFAQIMEFRDADFFKKHREIILYTPDRELRLQTVAAVYGDASGEKRRTKFDSLDAFNQYVDAMTKSCTFRDLPEGEIKHLYSFVTCSYEFEDARTILYAVDAEK